MHILTDIEKLPYILTIDLLPEEGDSGKQLGYSSYIPNITTNIELTTSDGSVVKYTLLSIKFGDNCHFTSVVNIDNQLYYYDGMVDGGRMSNIGKTPDNLTQDEIKKLGHGKNVDKLFFLRI